MRKIDSRDMRCVKIKSKTFDHSFINIVLFLTMPPIPCLHFFENLLRYDHE